MSATSITSKSFTVEEIFNKEINLSLPDEQRKYSWGKQQCDDLWNDIIRHNEFDKKSEFNFGMIIFSYTSQYENDHALVTDGQQRLTTTFIILLAKAIVETKFTGSNILDKFRSLKNNGHEGWKNSFEDEVGRKKDMIERDYLEYIYKVKIILNIFDSEDEEHFLKKFKDDIKETISILSSQTDNFKNTALSSIFSGSNKKYINNFINNLSFFINKMEKLREKDKEAYYSSLDTFGTKFKFVILEERSQTLFSRINSFNCTNSRGIKLSLIDSFKSEYLFRTIKNENDPGNFEITKEIFKEIYINYDRKEKDREIDIIQEAFIHTINFTNLALFNVFVDSRNAINENTSWEDFKNSTLWNSEELQNDLYNEMYFLKIFKLFCKNTYDFYFEENEMKNKYTLNYDTRILPLILPLINSYKNTEIDLLKISGMHALIYQINGESTGTFSSNKYLIKERQKNFLRDKSPKDIFKKLFELISNEIDYSKHLITCGSYLTNSNEYNSYIDLIKNKLYGSGGAMKYISAFYSINGDLTIRDKFVDIDLVEHHMIEQKVIKKLERALPGNDYKCNEFINNKLRKINNPFCNIQIITNKLNLAYNKKEADPLAWSHKIYYFDIVHHIGQLTQEEINLQKHFNDLKTLIEEITNNNNLTDNDIFKFDTIVNDITNIKISIARKQIFI